MANRSQTALIAMRQILRATEFNARNLASASGLTPSQLIVLQFLVDRGEATPSEIAKHVSLTQATVTSLLDKLEARAFITRRRDDKDRRRMLVKISSAGRQALKKSPNTLQKRFQERFKALESWEQSLIITALERVATLLDAEAIDAAPVLDVGAINELPQKQK